MHINMETSEYSIYVFDTSTHNFSDTTNSRHFNEQENPTYFSLRLQDIWVHPEYSGGNLLQPASTGNFNHQQLFLGQPGVRVSWWSSSIADSSDHTTTMKYIDWMKVEWKLIKSCWKVASKYDLQLQCIER